MATGKPKVSKVAGTAKGSKRTTAKLSVAKQASPKSEVKVSYPPEGKQPAFIRRVLDEVQEPEVRFDVSIVIPARIRTEQDALWLDEAVNSVLNQTKECALLIVLNGGDTKLEEGIQKRYKSVAKILISPEGISFAKNVGIKESKSDYFFLLDANDWLPPNAIEIAWLKKPEKGFLYGSTMLFRGDRNLGDQHLYEARPYVFEDVMKMVYFTGALQRKADWELAGGYRESLSLLEDWDYWLTCGEMGICGTPVQDVLYWYRQHDNGLVSGNKNTAEWESARKKVQDYHHAIYRGDYPMACCGNKSRKAAVQTYNPPTAQQLAPGADGMVLVEYVGGNSGKMTWWGAVTGTRYKAGGSLKQIYVDARDAVTGSKATPGFLELIEHGNPVFVQVKS